MSKKFIGSEGIKKIMDLGLKLFPNTEITSTEVNDMWNDLDKPADPYLGPESELDNWNYTLDKDYNLIRLIQFTNTDVENAIVYPRYEKDGKVYDTILNSMDNTTTDRLFCRKSSLKTITFKGDLDNKFKTAYFTVSNVMFALCTNLKEINGFEYVNTSALRSTRNMFTNCTNLTSVNLSKMNTAKVTNMYSMFSGCNSLTSLDLSSFDTSNVTDMRYMFRDCTNLKEIKVSRSKWVIPEGCDATDMFTDCGCSEVTYVD